MKLPLWFRRLFWSKQKKEFIDFIHISMIKIRDMSQEDFNSRVKELGIDKELENYFVNYSKENK
jgi:hypothetical protein